MPIEHLIHHVVAVPLLAAAAGWWCFGALPSPWRPQAGLRALLTFALGLAVGLLSNPNLALTLVPKEIEDWLGWTLLLALAIEGMRRVAQGWPWQLYPALALFLTWKIAVPVRDYFGWGAWTFSGILLMTAVAWGLLVIHSRDAARRLPAAAYLMLLLLQGCTLAYLAVAASFAIAAEAVGTACAGIGLLFLIAWWRPQSLDLLALSGPWVSILMVIALDAHWYADLPWLSLILVGLGPLVSLLPRPAHEQGRRHAIVVAAYALILFLPAALLGS